VIPELAALAFHACLASAPSFDGVESVFKDNGFAIAAKRGDDTRWSHAKGYETFLQNYGEFKVCTVAFDGKHRAATKFVGRYLKDNSQVPHKKINGQHGTEWQLDGGVAIRPLTKQGDRNRVLLAVFAYGEN